MKSLNASTLTDLTVTSLTASRALVIDVNKKLVSSTATAVEVGYLSGVTSLIQGQINSKQSTSEKGQANGYAPLDSSGFLPATYSEALTGDITSAAGSSVTAISAGVIVDADVNSSAAIGWTKISKTGSSLLDLATRSAADLSSGTLLAARLPALSGDITMAAGTSTVAITAGAIVDADINASAAITWTKISKTGSSLADLVTRSAGDLSSGTLLAARMPALTGDITMTAGTTTTAITAGVIVNADINASAQIDATKIGTAGITNTEFGYLDGVTSNIQTQLNGKNGLYVGTTAPSDTTFLWQQI